MVRYTILAVVLGVALGLFLSRTINDHFENYEKKCVSVLYEAGRQTARAEVPCP